MDTLITPQELAENLGTTVGTLSQWRYLGKGPKFVKTGRSIRYRVADVTVWMQENTRSQSGTAISA
jgi:predicted DNA-binding transcriptional regulator AlpA